MFDCTPAVCISADKVPLLGGLGCLLCTVLLVFRGYLNSFKPTGQANLCYDDCY
jgi:hypothetical protein